MTTKFEHSIINPLTKNTLIIHHCYQNPEINLPPPMERILKSQKIDSIKKMMLMQEQVFKQQVEEMHRLYNLQKKLMQEIENGQKQHNFQEFSSRNDPTNEVSGSNSAENMQQTPIKFDLEMAVDESTPSSSIHPFEEINKVEEEEEGGDVEVELTLSIGHCTRKQQRSKSTDQSRKVQESDHRMKEAQEVASSSSSVYQENRRRPHWLMQDLSLNRT